MGTALAGAPNGGRGGDIMRAVVVLPSTDKGLNRTYAGRACSMAVSDALEFVLPVGDGPAGPEGDETIYCDFSMLPEELGRRAGRALASMAAALRGDDSEFPWGEPDPVGVGIALQVLSFLPERTKAGKGPVYRIAFHEVSPDVGDAGRGTTIAPDRSDPAAVPGVVAVDADRRPIKRFLSTREAADYVGLSPKTLADGGSPARGRATSREGQGYFTKSSISTRGWRKENAGSRLSWWKNEAARPPMSAGRRDLIGTASRKESGARAQLMVCGDSGRLVQGYAPDGRETTRALSQSPGLRPSR